MAKLSSQEHYEVIRILLESKTEKVMFCSHDATNSYIDIILKKLNVTFTQCWKEELVRPLFDLHKVCTGSSQ